MTCDDFKHKFHQYLQVQGWFVISYKSRVSNLRPVPSKQSSSFHNHLKAKLTKQKKIKFATFYTKHLVPIERSPARRRALLHSAVPPGLTIGLISEQLCFFWQSWEFSSFGADHQNVCDNYDDGDGSFVVG